MSVHTELKELLFGELAVRAGLVTREQIEECLALQEKQRAGGESPSRLGEILAEKNYLYIDQVQAILRGEFSEPGKLFGEMAIQMGFLDHGRVNECLRIQHDLEVSQGPERPRLGTVLSDKGHLNQQQTSAVLEAQFKPEEAAKQIEPGGAQGLVARSADGREEGSARASVEIDRALAEPPVEVDTADIEAILAEAEAPAASARIVIGGYSVENALGSDSFGIVYKARSEKGGHAALKLLDLSRSRSKEFQERFVDEAKRGAQLSHPNIMRIPYRLKYTRS